MAYIRKKTIRGYISYYLVESRRENGRIRQKVLAYLGKNTSLDSAIGQLLERRVENRAWIEFLSARIGRAGQADTAHGTRRRRSLRKALDRYTRRENRLDGRIDRLQSVRKDLANDLPRTNRKPRRTIPEQPRRRPRTRRSSATRRPSRVESWRVW